MENSTSLTFTGNKPRILKIALVILALGILTLFLTLPDIQACARREPCDLSSCIAFLAAPACIYFAVHIFVITRRGLPKLELSPQHILLTRNGRYFAFAWSDITAIRRTAKLVYLSCRQDGQIINFTVNPGALLPAGCPAALDDYIARYFIPATATPTAPATPPPRGFGRLVLNAFLVLALEYAILFAATLLILVATIAVKAATGASPKEILNLLTLLCVVSAMQIGTALKARRWQPGIPALITGSLCYLLLCLLGLATLRGPDIVLGILLVLCVPLGLFLGFRQGGSFITTTVSK